MIRSRFDGEDSFLKPVSETRNNTQATTTTTGIHDIDQHPILINTFSPGGTLYPSAMEENGSGRIRDSLSITIYSAQPAMILQPLPMPTSGKDPGSSYSPGTTLRRLVRGRASSQSVVYRLYFPLIFKPAIMSSSNAVLNQTVKLYRTQIS